ncbi:MAG: hypothetical protein IJM15_04675 [Erysipelotrichaceae bacterium]|nr:hypothetical protein [Erysipelotrichaceae bacterium]
MGLLKAIKEKAKEIKTENELNAKASSMESNPIFRQILQEANTLKPAVIALSGRIHTTMKTYNHVKFYKVTDLKERNPSYICMDVNHIDGILENAIGMNDYHYRYRLDEVKTYSFREYGYEDLTELEAQAFHRALSNNLSFYTPANVLSSKEYGGGATQLGGLIKKSYNGTDYYQAVNVPTTPVIKDFYRTYYLARNDIGIPLTYKEYEKNASQLKSW